MMRQTPSPGTADDLYALGYALFSQDDFKRAIAAFRAMLLVAPQDERAWIGLGEAHAMLSDIGVAIELLGAGMVACRSARAGLARARLLEAEGQRAELAETLSHVARLINDSTDDAVRKEYCARMNLH